MLTCHDVEGDCCAGCHEDDDLEDIENDAGEVVARVCCAKRDAAKEQLGIPLPPRIATVQRFR